ncbi:MAG: flagellar basal body L-ring protein FlgH [Geminicoccaceae bacterium]
MRRTLMVIFAGLLITGCNAGERLANIGKAPDLSPIENPVQAPGYQAVNLPMPAPEFVGPMAANSLWRQGARGFFKDQRAGTVGDVLTVKVTISDRASLNNQTSRSRDNEEDLGVGGFFGLESELDQVFPDAVDSDNLIGLDSSTSNTGRGTVTRNEQIVLNVAALVTQVLPNGNLVISGRQEVRVNFEVRELFIAGVVRPEDITPFNTISHEQIAELRVAYGGRGQISDFQQPRYGTQVLDVILPF